MLSYPVTLAHHLVPIPPRPSALHLPAHSTSLVPSFLNFELSTFNSELPPPRLTPFPSHHSKPRARNSFPLISFQETGGYSLTWSYQSRRDALFTGHWLRVTGLLFLLLTPFPRSLTHKQGGTGHWSYQFSSLSTVDCRLLAFHSFSPPCPASHFPLQWEIPFPVITGENQ